MVTMGVKQLECEDLPFRSYADDTIVVSGMSGKFPESDSVSQFCENLYNKIHMVTTDDRRWNDYNSEIPHGSGKISEIDKFDIGFFGYSLKEGNKLEAAMRIGLEQTFQAILDAGYNPVELRGSNTGVFVGICVLESALTYHRAQLPRIIGYTFQLNGPSFITDTACSSSLYALDAAYDAMNSGLCDRALVLGINLCLVASTSLQFARLGVLSKDSRCKSFDESGNGYARSEGVASILLEKYKTARRMYGEVVHSKTNADGYKSQGITFPSCESQINLLREFYEECKVDPTTVSFVEAHGTGTKVGDPEELNTLDSIYCTNRKTPLYLGSVKSNVGHQEPASGITALIKVLGGMEAGYIPPNINYSKPRSEVEGLVQGRMLVVTEKMPWPDKNGLVAVNNFGFGGANAHVLLRGNMKTKIKGCLPKDDLPRIVVFSGRTEASVLSFISDFVARPLDVEYIRLLHDIFKFKINGYDHVGYVVKEKDGFAVTSSASVEQKRRMCFVFSNPDKTWFELAKQLACFGIFSDAIERIRSKIYNEIDVDISDVVNSLNTIEVQEALGTIIIQIAIVEVLRQIGVEPDLLVGIGVGELVAAYFDGFLTLRETVMSAFYFVLDRNTFYDSLENIVTSKPLKSKIWTSVNVTDDNQNDITNNALNYFQNNLLNPVSMKKIENAIGNETVLGIIGPTVDFESDLAVTIVPSTSTKVSCDFLISLGRLHQKGFDMKLNLLYPEVSYPVSRGTPMISHHLHWLHETPRDVHIGITLDINGGHQFYEYVAIKSPFWTHLSGHVINERNLFPATGYLFLVWKHFMELISSRLEESRVIFKDVKFVKAVNADKEYIRIWIGIEMNTHRFEISEDDDLIVHGFIEEAPEDESIMDLPIPEYSYEEVLEERDIYKELRLRGYNYRDEFRSLKKCRVDGSRGTVLWNNNWITFMDNMLQLMLLKVDTKNLYIPTGIQQLIIDSKLHLSKCEYYQNNVPVVSPRGLNFLVSGGIQINGLSVAQISRRRTPEPVLEYSKFVPNEGAQSTRDAIRCFIQLILENTRTPKFKSIEVAQDEELITPLVQASLGDLPLIKPELVIFTKTTVELANVRVESGDSIAESDCILVIVSGASQNQEMMDKALQATKQINGYILTREDLEINRQTLTSAEVAVMCEIKTNKETLILLRRTSKSQERSYLNLTNSLHNTDWISTLQEMMKTNQNVVLYAENSNCNGILGLVNCLRQEFPDDRITCVFLMDEAPKFNPDDDFYKTQLNKNMAVNIWKDKQWGTYRHLELVSNQTVESEHCFAKTLSPGDLSSIRWIENSLSTGCYAEPEKELVHIYYCALNFRDVMTASGKISPDVITKDRILQECCQGFEFSGRTSSGRRIMGTINSGALSSLIMADSHTTLPVPDEWSLEDAATVIVVYTTVAFGFFQRSNLQRGQSILIHSGTGGVGQAAINVATHYDCTIFTTVGTPEKKEFIRKHFPQIKEEHIGDSRSTSFEEMIRYHTDGRGVDVVLNSLAEDKLQASMRCLARKGTFLEIGKFDMAQNNHIAMSLLNKEAQFAGVMLDQIFSVTNEMKTRLLSYCREGIEQGFVKPLTRTTFKSDDIEAAFRYMATGKHMGKVLVKMRDEENEKMVLPTVQMFRGIPRFFCKTGCTYVVVGGLGGFGLELADWLMVRGAKNLVLTSRTGVKNGFQRFRISVFKSYGVKTIIRNDDVSTEAGCRELLTAAEKLGPIDAIFNLAVILQDGLFENQTPETFKTSLAPKAYATKNLDVVSREICPSLRYFVIFSSVSCGRGNAGQTNYGMANSVMERICEQRKRDGYPALAIQWGAIGDVGLVAEMQERDTDMVIGGTVQQRIRSCLKVLDSFLKQDEPIVGSMVVAEKKSAAGLGNLMDTVLHILGVTNIKAISEHATFPELGMDSIMAVELKQVLETDYDIVLGPQDLRNLTLAKLKEMVEEKSNPDRKTAVADEEQFDVGLLMKHVGDETVAYLPAVKLETSIDDDAVAPHVFALAGIEGAAVIYTDFAKKLNFHLTCLQFIPDRRFESIEEQAEALVPAIESTPGDFVLLAYSFGCGIATEIVHRLEQRGKKGKVIFIDGSPEFINKMTHKIFPVDEDENLLQTTILFWFISRYVNLADLDFLAQQQNIANIPTLEGKVKACLELKHEANINYSNQYITDITISGYHRLLSSVKYTPPAEKSTSDVMLCKPAHLALTELTEDYGLSNLFVKPAVVRSFSGNHLTVLENDELASAINKYVLDEST